jgi:nitrite reductase (NO-forming)
VARSPAGEGRSQEPPMAPEPVAVVPAGLFALVAAMSVLALAISIVAIIVAGGSDDERSTAESGGPVKTLAIELGDLFVKPDRVEVPAGTHLMVEVTNKGEQVHTLNLQGGTGTDRLQPGAAQTVDFGVIDADTQAWCTVPGHKEAGMLLDIVVTEPVPHTTTTTTTAPPGA